VGGEKENLAVRVVIACGGTGGHLFPGIAVAQALRRHGAQTLLLVSRKTIDRQASQAGMDVRAEVIPAIGSPGRLSPRWIPFGVQFSAAVRCCLKILREFQPDIVLGMGGFTSAPPILAARLLGIPSVIHESNAVPGKANRWASRWVNAVAVGMADCARFFPRDKVVVTGTPVRDGWQRLDAAEARQKLGLHPDRATVLVMGGSQGARGINAGVAAVLPALQGLRDSAQFIHLCGAQDTEWIRNVYAAQNCAARVESFLREMELAYSAASFVVARAGASSLAETAHFGLPSILVPYPLAADQHQLRNARVFERSGAAVIVEQRNLKSEAFVSAIRGLLINELLRGAMARAAKRLAVEDAADRVARLVLMTAAGRGIELAEGASEIGVAEGRDSSACVAQVSDTTEECTLVSR
jgi:UDP-N-acetylglucosamine--N-acetylmuramyl-(pentapeptide) pyrophosphoryl-undecaprenol N-acetylglucosamine transferase